MNSPNGESKPDMEAISPSRSSAPTTDADADAMSSVARLQRRVAILTYDVEYCWPEGQNKKTSLKQN